jgi:hypothetical protein
VTTVCPETTGVYTIYKTWTCSAPAYDCSSGVTKTAAATVTVSPAKTLATPTIVPGYTPGASGPATYSPGITTIATAASKASNATATAKPTTKVVNAGAAQLSLMPTLAVLVIGGLLAVIGI